MIKKANKYQQKQQYRINQRISANQLRVLDAESKQIGVMTRYDALQMAQEQQLDLVEIAPQASPPVAKLIDYKKFLYQLEKKRREEKRKAKVSDTKELRLGPFMSDNDLQVIIRRGREFIEAGDKVRLVVKFKGRQITHPEFGREILGKVIRALNDISKVERDPHMEGRQLIVLLSVMKGKKTE